MMVCSNQVQQGDQPVGLTDLGSLETTPYRTRRIMKDPNSSKKSASLNLESGVLSRGCKSFAWRGERKKGLKKLWGGKKNESGEGVPPANHMSVENLT